MSGCLNKNSINIIDIFNEYIKRRRTPILSPLGQEYILPNNSKMIEMSASFMHEPLLIGVSIDSWNHREWAILLVKI